MPEHLERGLELRPLERSGLVIERLDVEATGAPRVARCGPTQTSGSVGALVDDDNASVSVRWSRASFGKPMTCCPSRNSMRPSPTGIGVGERQASCTPS